MLASLMMPPLATVASARPPLLLGVEKPAPIQRPAPLVAAFWIFSRPLLATVRVP